jgi:MoxR-like ATPase
MTLEELKMLYQQLQAEASKVLVGLETPFRHLIIALFSQGHVLIEGVPGTAKTLMAKLLAHLIEADYSRIQFTPDLMPYDILGTSIFDMPTNQFFLKKGPIFTNILLADEINRAPAKTQAALLEAMEERQIDLEGEQHMLPPPFMVIATQNPIEYEGTYPLPEAQLDRFMFKILIDSPPLEVDVEVLNRYHRGFDPHDLAASGISPILMRDILSSTQKLIQDVIVEEGILTYIAQLAQVSRQTTDLMLGASTRAAIHVLLAAKTNAALEGREYVTPDDVKWVIPPIFRHRLLLTPEAEIEGLDVEAMIVRLLAEVEVPR